MPQGSVKRKSSAMVKKAKTQKKSLGVKKGGRAIKPKKGTTSSAVIVKKKIEVQIKQTIETSTVQKAQKSEHKPLALIRAPALTTGKKNTKGKKGKGK